MSKKFFIVLGFFGIAFIAIAAFYTFYLISIRNYVPAPKVSISTMNGNVEFLVEVAKTQEEHAKGLMHRKSLKKTGGMLFVLDKPRTVNFWMKNTLIPLDMIFINENMKIVRIEYHAQPCPQGSSTCPFYSSTVPIKYVLEIGADLAKINNIEVGNDVVIYLVE